MRDRNEVAPPSCCASCCKTLRVDSRGLNTCDTAGCLGNLLERFPVEGDNLMKPKTKRRRGRRRSARN